MRSGEANMFESATLNSKEKSSMKPKLQQPLTEAEND